MYTETGKNHILVENHRIEKRISLPHPTCSQASFTGGGWPWAEGTGQAARKSEFYSWRFYRFPWARQLTLWSTFSVEVRPNFSFCIHNIFKGENRIVGLRSSVCIFRYPVCFLFQVVGCTIADNCVSNKIKHSNTAGGKMSPDTDTFSLSAQLPHM